MPTSVGHLKASHSIPVNQVFDVDQRTGFMAPRAPIARLPSEWELWEETLDSAVSSRLQLGDKVGLTVTAAATSSAWRKRVREVRLKRLSFLSDHN